MTIEVGLQPGDRLGRYIVQRLLGSGTMGTVYAAFDPQLDRAVAVKLLRADAASPRARTGFLREAKATAQLVHRNVVTIHDVGIVGEQLFLAMELVDGPTLREWLRAPRGWRDVLAVMRAAGEGLVAAHAAGIVHRDFKPDNVLLTGARVVVTDFGLAHRMDDSTASDVEIVALEAEQPPLEATFDGAFQGTAAYAAPEQREGRQCDARADQYAFCVTMHEALWGERPIVGEPLPVRGAPSWLRRAVARGLATAPEDRFTDMRALLHALDPRRRRPSSTLVAGVGAVGVTLALSFAVVRDEPVRASYCDHVDRRLDGVWDDASRREIEQAFLATGEPSAADAVQAVTARIDEFADTWVVAQTQACHAEQDGSVAADVVARRMTCLDRQLGRASAIADALRTVDREAVLRSAETVEHLGTPDVCADDRGLSRQAEARAGIDAVTRDEIDATIERAEALAHTARYTEAEAVARESLARAKAVGDRWATAEALLTVGDAQQFMQAPTAEQTFHDSLSAALAVEHHRVAALSMLGLLELWNPGDEGGITRAEQWERHCHATLDALGGDPEIEVELLVGMGNAYLRSADYERAEALYQRAFAVPGIDDKQILLAGAHANIGAIAAAKGSYRDALAGFQRSYELLVATYGARHPNVAGAAINVGSALGELGDLEAARVEHMRALEILEENFGDTHASLAPALRMLAWNALARREFAEALPYAERALAIARRESGERSESTARSLSMVSSITIELGRVEEARAQADAALDIARDTLGAEHPTVAEFETDCGIVATRASADEIARRHFARAIALRERALGPNDGEVARAWGGLAELEIVRGRGDAAIDAASRVVAIMGTPGNERGGARPEAAFLLARALVVRGTAADRVRARKLADAAHADFIASGPAWRARADEIAKWLAQR
ncbi:MAG TPA: serine/threonine-protein kinase [Nannocystaceae bacterium]|nr:serine/threonine-protein kinase [Nannocystaceae bacterium]